MFVVTRLADATRHLGVIMGLLEMQGERNSKAASRDFGMMTGKNDQKKRQKKYKVQQS